MHEEYSLNQHKHNFAIWAASRSIRGFSGDDGKRAFKIIGLDKIYHPDDLPSPQDMDAYHKRWRTKICSDCVVKHGVAAKLINMYLKSVFVCGGYDTHKNVKALHPPIDKILLTNLCAHHPEFKKSMKQLKTQSWMNFSSDDYQLVIDEVRFLCKKGEGLWTIEKYWP